MTLLFLEHPKPVPLGSQDLVSHGSCHNPAPFKAGQNLDSPGSRLHPATFGAG